MPLMRVRYTVIVVGWDCFFGVTFVAAFDPEALKGTLDLQLLVRGYSLFQRCSMLYLSPKPHMMHTLFVCYGLAIIVSSE